MKESCLLQYLTKAKIFTGVPEAHDSEESQPAAAGPLPPQQEQGKLGCFSKCNTTTTVNSKKWKTVKHCNFYVELPSLLTVKIT